MKIGINQYALVTAQACSAHHGTPTGPIRTEKIDLVNNRLFHECKTIRDILDAYSRFWNHMNDNPVDLVFVHSITLTAK